MSPTTTLGAGCQHASSRTVNVFQNFEAFEPPKVCLCRAVNLFKLQKAATLLPRVWTSSFSKVLATPNPLGAERRNFGQVKNFSAGRPAPKCLSPFKLLGAGRSAPKFLPSSGGRGPGRPAPNARKWPNPFRSWTSSSEPLPKI